jgi:hypothetical protein
LYAKIENISKLGRNFHASSAGLSLNTSNLNDILSNLAKESINIVNELKNTANMFADEYSILDKMLASGETHKPNVKE